MNFKAEIFDLLLYLFETTGFNDHQLHCVIKFSGKVDAAAMDKAFRLLIETVPILARVYRDFGGTSYWDDSVTPNQDFFKTTNSSDDFDRFTLSKTNAETGPQIKACLLHSDSDTLSVVANHMVMDGAGFKECIYLLSTLYSEVIKDPDYKPDFIIDGNRGYKRLLSGLRLRDKLRILFFRSGDNNTSGKYLFPLPGGDDAEPFIYTHELTPQKYHDIVSYSKKYAATVNDVILAAYFRTLSFIMGLNGKELCVPLMIDMRRYQKDEGFFALTNLASTEILRFAVNPEESFADTLVQIAGLTKSQKNGYFGLNSFVKLETLFKVFGRKRAFNLLKNKLNNPNICMTNIGIIQESKLVFKETVIENAIITGSIKYRPHFQLSLSSYGNKMTLAVNLYGSQRDREQISKFFKLMAQELDTVAPI